MHLDMACGIRSGEEPQKLTTAQVHWLNHAALVPILQLKIFQTSQSTGTKRLQIRQLLYRWLTLPVLVLPESLGLISKFSPI